ncbi:MAG: UDP-N-acetylmuramate dehydrogenase [Campylobacterales bacterium]
MTKPIDFSVFSSLKIGSLLEVRIIDSEIPKQDMFIIGGANNLLFSPSPSQPLAMLSKVYDYIEIRDGFLHIGGATPNGKIFSYAKKNNIAGFEILPKLPGKIGGAVYMNAGLKGDEISQNLVSIKTSSGYLPKENIEFEYRKSSIEDIIYEAVFEIKKGFSVELEKKFKNMRSNQPSEPSAGSCFKNPKDDFAGRIIEAVGLKGYRVGGAAFSEVHANFLVNLGGASFFDAKSLIDEAKKRAYDRFGVELELEIKIV